MDSFKSVVPLEMYDGVPSDKNNDPHTMLFELVCYGYNTRRATIQVRVKVPVEIRGNADAINAWAQGEVLFGTRSDTKHTRGWLCEFCGKPARETVRQVTGWSHLTPPRMVMYIHNMCNALKEPCKTDMLDVQKLQHLMINTPLPPDDYTAVDSGDYPLDHLFPLAGSCAQCQEDATAGGDLQRCSRCKLTRYCGVACQKKDWPRHKINCSRIKLVVWENWGSKK